MTKAIFILAVFLLSQGFLLHAESFRTIVEGSILISHERQIESDRVISIGIDGSVLINLSADVRFIRGVEIEITAPQAWLQYRGSLAMTMYNGLNPKTGVNITEFNGRRIAFEPLPSRLRTVYHIPIRQQHGLRTTTSVTVPTNVITPDSFPILFRLSPIEKGLSSTFEQLRFNVVARPILSDEGAVRIVPRFPPQQRNRPFTVLINDNVISNISEEIVLKEGEHHLVIRSDDYRNESRRFLVERAKVIDLIIELQDPTPSIIFESPPNAVIFLNNTPVPDTREPVMTEPGVHEIRIQIGDYIVVRTLTVQRGKTYRIALDIDLTINEED